MTTINKDDIIQNIIDNISSCIIIYSFELKLTPEEFRKKLTDKDYLLDVSKKEPYYIEYMLKHKDYLLKYFSLEEYDEDKLIKLFLNLIVTEDLYTDYIVYINDIDL